MLTVLKGEICRHRGYSTMENMWTPSERMNLIGVADGRIRSGSWAGRGAFEEDGLDLVNELEMFVPG
jgi:hypothetical protein